MPRSRYTDFMVLVDPHIVPGDDTEQEEWTQKLMDAVREFVTAPVLRQVLLCEDSTKLRAARLVGASVELGDLYGRVHIHFNLSLTHETQVYLKSPDGREINRVFAEWFSRRLGKDGVFVSVKLADTSRAKNYATKSGERAADSVTVRGLAAGSSAPANRDQR